MSDDFQARASKEGRLAQDIAAQVITGAGFTIESRNEVLQAGVTVNFIATDKQGGRWYFDISGAFTSTRPGLQRTDTVWKTLGRANVLSSLGIERLVFLTTNLPKPGSVGDRALRTAAASFFDLINMTSVEGRTRLRRYAEGGERILPLPGFRTAEDLYRDVAVPPAYGANLAVPVETVGTIPGLTARRKELAHRIEAIVPSLDRLEQPIAEEARAEAVRSIKSVLSDYAGGCTAYEGKGSWVHPIEGVMDEDVSGIHAYCAVPFDDLLVSKVVSIILTELNQHTAAVVVDEVMYHFTADD